MRKTIIILIVILSFLGCKDDVPAQKQEHFHIDSVFTTKEHIHIGCECGTILSREILTYSLNIKNNCSENVKRFYFKKEMWDFYSDHKSICLKNSW